MYDTNMRRLKTKNLALTNLMRLSLYFASAELMRGLIKHSESCI